MNDSGTATREGGGRDGCGLGRVSRFVAVGLALLFAATAGLNGRLPGESEMPGGARLVFRAQENSSVKIRGRATLGAWECSTRDIIAIVEPGAALEALSAAVRGRRMGRGVAGTSAGGEGGAHEVPYANITIAVDSLRCDKPGMRADLLRALKAEEAPLIVFVLTGLNAVEVEGRGEGDLGRYRVTARGDLVLGGVLRAIEVVGAVVQEGPRRFRVEAEKELRMSDFGIVPPTALFGAIRADDRVSIAFDLRFEATGELGRVGAEIRSWGDERAAKASRRVARADCHLESRGAFRDRRLEAAATRRAARERGRRELSVGGCSRWCRILRRSCSG